MKKHSLFLLLKISPFKVLPLLHRCQAYRVLMLTIFLYVMHLPSFAQQATVTKVQGGNCVGDNMVFAFGGPTCTLTWIIQLGIDYTIVNSSNSSLTIKFNQPVGNNALTVTANYYSCNNNQSGGVNSAYFSVHGLDGAGTISGNQTICYNGNPTILNNSIGASGVGYSYQWQYSINGGSTWSNISGATSTTYDPSNLTVTTRYRRKVTGCGITMYSNVVIVTVQPTLNPGSISSNKSICHGGDPSAFTSTAASGGNGSYSYQWQKSINGGSTWTDVSGATSATYNPPVLTTTTLYRRRVISCNQTGYSNVVTVTVNLPGTPAGLGENGVDYNQFNALWNTVSCASYYEVEISVDNNWNNTNNCGPYINYDTDYSFQQNTGSLCNESLQSGERYYWRVRACSSIGTCFSWSAERYIDLPNAMRKLQLEDQETGSEALISIYPNPTYGKINLQNVHSAKLLSLTGKILLHDLNNEVDLGGLPIGLYLLKGYDMSGQPFEHKVLKK